MISCFFWRGWATWSLEQARFRTCELLLKQGMSYWVGPQFRSQIFFTKKCYLYRSTRVRALVHLPGRPSRRVFPRHHQAPQFWPFPGCRSRFLPYNPTQCPQGRQLVSWRKGRADERCLLSNTGTKPYLPVFEVVIFYDKL